MHDGIRTTLYKKMKKIGLALLVFFSLFGIFFIGLLAHEAFHVATNNGATSVCWDIGYKTTPESNIMGYDTFEDTGFLMMHVYIEDFPPELSELSALEEWIDLNEKWAMIIQYVVMLLLSFIIGVETTILYLQSKRAKARRMLNDKNNTHL